MQEKPFSEKRGERLERRDRDTRSQVLQSKKEIDHLKEGVENLRGEVRRDKEDLASHEGRITRVEQALGLSNYSCPHCGATGAHYAFACSSQ